MKTKFKALIGATAITVALATTGTLQAKTYKITVAAAPPPMVTFVATFKNIVSKKINERLKAAGKGDQIKWTHAYAQQLAKFHELFEAVEDGIAGAGLILKNFEPSNLPMESYGVYAPFVATTRVQRTEIDNKLRTLIPELNEAYTKHNQVFIQSGVNDSMQMMTKFPIKKVEDLKGRRSGLVVLTVSGSGEQVQRPSRPR